MSEELSPFMREIVARLDGKEKAAKAAASTAGASVLSRTDERVTFAWLTVCTPDHIGITHQQRLLNYPPEGYGLPTCAITVPYLNRYVTLWQCDASCD